MLWHCSGSLEAACKVDVNLHGLSKTLSLQEQSIFAHGHEAPSPKIVCMCMDLSLLSNQDPFL